MEYYNLPVLLGGLTEQHAEAGRVYIHLHRAHWCALMLL